jgi:hypothetical protein
MGNKHFQVRLKRCHGWCTRGKWSLQGQPWYKCGHFRDKARPCQPVEGFLKRGGAARRRQTGRALMCMARYGVAFALDWGVLRDLCRIQNIRCYDNHAF